ncbi:unnamed protein product [Brugia pahangi]|uniref:Macro domain-containing protein n=1 Tax=Brugia pahangi TaxID=6280 RepID=A0A0N4TMF4_BRUPA|nr:unnamed protein product [Brugia pahangi]
MINKKDDNITKKATTSRIENTKIIPAETIVLTVSTAEGKQNKTEGMLYRDKILTIVEKVIERNDNPCATYVIEEINDKTTFSKLLSKTEVICELENIFHDVKSNSDISVTNLSFKCLSKYKNFRAIESFRKIPWSSRITNIIFVPDVAMYRNRKMYKNDMKSAKDLLKQMAEENPISSPRIIIGNPVYFQNIDTLSAYSSQMNVDQLIEAILHALQTKDFTTPEDLLTSTASTNEYETGTSTIHGEIEFEDIINSTVTSSDLLMTVTESECVSSRILVSSSVTKSEIVSSFTSTIIHRAAQKVERNLYHVTTNVALTTALFTIDQQITFIPLLQQEKPVIFTSVIC